MEMDDLIKPRCLICKKDIDSSYKEVYKVQRMEADNLGIFRSQFFRTPDGSVDLAVLFHIECYEEAAGPEYALPSLEDLKEMLK